MRLRLVASFASWLGNIMELDRSLLSRKIEVIALRIETRRTGEYLFKLRDHLLNLPRVRNAVNCGEKKLILLSQRYTDVSQIIEENGWLSEKLESTEMSSEKYTINLDYNHFTADEALKELLPTEVSIPSSFEQAGHLIHLNLRPEHEPYKKIIGQVILDKIKSCRTVVNKIGEINNEFRTFPLEILAGENNTYVILREHDCSFGFDYSKVYWNSRLSSEHARIVDLMNNLKKHNEHMLVADATCGAGPFAIPLAKNYVQVLANDLNPAAVDAIQYNGQKNKCLQFLSVHGPSCARHFLREQIDSKYTHVIFNLPATGLDLLDAFRGLKFSSNLPPLVFCYCFAPKDNKEGTLIPELQFRLQRALGLSSSDDTPHSATTHPLPPDSHRQATQFATDGFLAIRWIRNVSPNKDMFCLTFRVPSACATLEPILLEERPSPPAKRPRKSNNEEEAK